MAALPETLTRKEHVDPDPSIERWVRRGGLALVVAFLGLGLANVFGQASSEQSVGNDTAELTVRAPDSVRSGLVYQVLFRIDARVDLEEPALVLDPGWFESFTTNSYQPEPVEWEHRAGRNVLVYGPIKAGEHLIARLQYQVNPTAVGPRTQNVVLEEKGSPLLTLEHDLFIYP